VEAHFLYSNPNVDASKIAYDLAMAYAHTKCEEMLLRYNPAKLLANYPPMSPCEKEMLFLQEKFKEAYDFYMKAAPGVYEQDED